MSPSSIYHRLKGISNRAAGYLIDSIDERLRSLEGQPSSPRRQVYRDVLRRVTDLCWWVQHTPRVDVWQWKSDHGSVVYAGSVYHMAQLQTILSPNEQSPVQVNRVKTWNLATENKQWVENVDIVVSELNRSQPWETEDAYCFTMSPWVRTVLDITPSADELMSNMRKSMRKRLRKVLKKDFQCRHSQDPADFDIFYHTMLTPFVESRFQEQAITASYDNLLAEFHQGGLIMVEQDGEPVSGVMYLHTDSTFYSTWGGVLNGDYSLMEQGVQMARVWFGINLAKEMNCRYYDFGRVFASMTDGLMRFKLGWGIQLKADHRLHETWTLLTKTASPELRRHLNKQQFLASVGDQHYIIFLQAPNDTARKTAIQERMDIAQRYGLAGVLIVKSGSWTPMPIPNL